MGLKELFTSEEWENLVSLPYGVSMAVMVASPNVLGIWSETKAMMQEPAVQAAQSGSPLVGLLLADLQPRIREILKTQQEAWKHDQAGYQARTLDACRRAAGSLAKISPEEASAYKKWVLGIGLKVAEAAKEHGVAVSDPEKAALAEFAGALGTPGE